MKLRGLTRVASATGVALLIGLSVAAPASAAETGKLASLAMRPLDQPLLAKDFATKDCAGVPGGAKGGTDGWVFNKPLKDAGGHAYLVSFLTDKSQPVLLALGKDGLVAIDIFSNAAWPDGEVSGIDVKQYPHTAAPAGVAGGLSGDGGWLQTPAGWSLLGGSLLHVDGKAEARVFDLVRVCAPKPSPLPVTGTNAAIIAGAGGALVILGAGLFVLRRRREAVKFVA